MTVIAAVATRDRVVMGCDTRAEYDGTALYLATGKIASFVAPNGDRVLLGFAGAAAIHSVLTRQLTIPETPTADDFAAADAWAAQLALEATTILAEATPPLTVQDSEGCTAIDGVALLAWRQHLWLLQTLAAFRPRTGVHALGSGMDVALGAMHMALEAGYDAEKAVERAVELACDFAGGCGIDDRGPLLYSTKAD